MNFALVAHLSRSNKGTTVGVSEQSRARSRALSGLDGAVAAGAAAAISEVLAHLREICNNVKSKRKPSYSGRSAQLLRNGDRLAARLLAFAERQALRPTRVEVQPFLSAFVELLRRVVDSRIAVEAQVHPDCLPWHVDTEALREALMELVLNASDAMPDGGRLLFRASPCPLNDTEETALDIVDTGAGMAAAVLDMAAAPFFTTKENSPLSGMGLPAVGGFAAQSGGSMSISSAAGRGTSITLRLPTESGVGHSNHTRDGG